MNKYLFLLLFIFASKSWAQTEHQHWIGGRFELGYPHVGSYGKERPILSLEPEFQFRFSKRFSTGIGSGIALYPATFTIPVHALGTYHFQWGKQQFQWTHRLGLNLRISPNSFFSYRYNTDVRWVKSINSIPFFGFVGLGSHFIWDRFGGASLSGALNIGFYFLLG